MCVLTFQGVMTNTCATFYDMKNPQFADTVYVFMHFIWLQAYTKMIYHSVVF